MGHYIDKDVLVSEIRSRLIPTVVPRGMHYDDWDRGADCERLKILDFIDTLEVKEMQYIDKDAIVNEIERWIKHYNFSAKEFGDEGYKDNVLMEQCKASACERILSFINTLEVKEMQYIDKDTIVDEIKKLMYAANLEADIASTGECFDENIADAKYQLYKYILSAINTFKVKDVDLDKEIDLVEDRYHGFESLSRADVIDIAKHFFELGFKMQKGE